MLHGRQPVVLAPGAELTSLQRGAKRARDKRQRRRSTQGAGNTRRHRRRFGRGSECCGVLRCDAAPPVDACTDGWGRGTTRRAWLSACTLAYFGFPVSTSRFALAAACRSLCGGAGFLQPMLAALANPRAEDLICSKVMMEQVAQLLEASDSLPPALTQHLVPGLLGTLHAQQDAMTLAINTEKCARLVAAGGGAAYGCDFITRLDGLAQVRLLPPAVLAAGVACSERQHVNVATERAWCSWAGDWCCWECWSACANQLWSGSLSTQCAGEVRPGTDTGVHLGLAVHCMPIRHGPAGRVCFDEAAARRDSSSSGPQRSAV